jgi:predicted dehydrogenase
MDLGPHLVDQALTLFGVPEGITASVRKDRDSTAIEDAFDITLEYPRLRAHCRSSMLACDAAPRFLLHGTRGSFKKWGLDPQEPALVGGARVPRMREGETVKKSDISPGYVTELLPLRPSDIIMEGDIEKGYRTFGEVNNLLPGDITTAPDLDDLLTRINTQGIAFLSGESELTGERQKYEPEWLAEPESQWGTLTVAPVLADPGTLTRTRVKTELGDYRRYYANVRDAINGVAKLAVTPEDGYRVIRLLEMARESSAAGKTLKVEF